MFSRRYYGDILPINMSICLSILVWPKINDIRGNLSHRWRLTFDPNTQVKKCQELYPQSWHRVLEWHRAMAHPQPNLFVGSDAELCQLMVHW